MQAQLSMGFSVLQYFEKNSSSQRKLTRIGGAAHSLENISGPEPAPAAPPPTSGWLLT